MPYYIYNKPTTAIDLTFEKNPIKDKKQHLGVIEILRYYSIKCTVDV